MATVTASQHASSVKRLHTGVQVVGCHFVTASTLTAASVVKLVKVPNGATIVGWSFNGADAAAAAQVIDIGTSNSPSALGSFSISAAAAHSHLDHLALIPTRIFLSDDAQPSEVWIEAKIAVAASASADYRFQLFYVNDGMRGTQGIR